MGSCDGQRRSATGDGKLPLEKIGGIIGSTILSYCIRKGADYEE